MKAGAAATPPERASLDNEGNNNLTDSQTSNNSHDLEAEDAAKRIREIREKTEKTKTIIESNFENTSALFARCIELQAEIVKLQKNHNTELTKLTKSKQTNEKQIKFLETENNTSQQEIKTITGELNILRDASLQFFTDKTNSDNTIRSLELDLQTAQQTSALLKTDLAAEREASKNLVQENLELTNLNDAANTTIEDIKSQYEEYKTLKEKEIKALRDNIVSIRKTAKEYHDLAVDLEKMYEQTATTHSTFWRDKTISSSNRGVGNTEINGKTNVIREN